MKIELRENISMFETQKKTLAVLCQRPRIADFSEMGAGKSLPQAILAKGVIDDGLCDYSVIVTLKAVLGDWCGIYEDFIQCDSKKLVLRYHNVPSRLKQFVKFRPIIITTYEMLVSEFERFYELFCNYRVNFVLDEAHRVRTPGDVWLNNAGKLQFRGSKRTAVCTALAWKAKRFYPLTGTPIVNGLKNAFSYINMLLPKQVYATFDSFKRMHMVFGKGSRSVQSYKNVDKLTALIDQNSIRFLKREVKDLPPVTYTKRELDWDPKQKAYYRQMMKDHILELQDHFLEAEGVGARLTRLHQILTNPKQLGLDCDSTRFEALDEDLESIGLDEHKVVIFAHYRHTIERLKEKYAHLNPAVVYGGTRDIDEQKRKFNEDDSCKLFIAHPQSAGLGINLTVSDYIIFFEYSYDLDGYDQAVARVDRPGQTRAVTVINYGVRGSMEFNKILPALINKKQLSMTVLKDPAEFMKFVSFDDDEWKEAA